ncbi:MAG: GIY-YIG nuclease family protein [Acidobacteria bacterium]|nr:GIY-YIG nuclease family protein [Acidobacteriota bacterium]
MFGRRKPPDPEVQASLELSFRVLGTVARKRNRLRFPSAPSKPGVYRIRLVGAGRTGVYVGETTNLSQRFGQYTSPGPSKATNLRLNELIATAGYRGRMGQGSARIRQGSAPPE